ncbi:hypothetical protein AGMMS49921_14120 [Endomicrobiia bacterium]|nr:hypothetical protein AGMMS49921_14120 [Endomicrobiia bacterium]
MAATFIAAPKFLDVLRKFEKSGYKRKSVALGLSTMGNILSKQIYKRKELV